MLTDASIPALGTAGQTAGASIERWSLNRCVARPD